MRQTVLWQLKKLSKIYSKTSMLIFFYIKMFPTLLWWNRIFSFFDSPFANIFERFDNFMNFLYSG